MEENEFEKAVCKLVSILSWPQGDNHDEGSLGVLFLLFDALLFFIISQ